MSAQRDEEAPLLASPSPKASGFSPSALGTLSEHSASDSVASWDANGGSESSERRKKSSKVRFFNLRLKWTDSLRHRAADHYHGNVYPAAFLLRDAILGTGAEMTGVVRAAGAYDFNPHSETNRPIVNQISLICRWFLAREIVYNLVHLTAWVLVLISFVEPPGWCRHYVTASGDKVGCDALLSARGPPAFGDEDEVQYYPNTNMTFFTVEDSLVIEGVCIAIMIFYMALLIGRDGLSISRFFYFFKKRTDVDNENIEHNVGARIVRIVLVCSVLAMIWGMASYWWLEKERPFAPFLRLLVFVSFSSGTQKELSTVIRMTPELVSILFILLIVIVFYAWIGVVAFFETKEGFTSFCTLVEAMWTLWMCVTTVNYPDVIMPAYNTSRVTALYFVTFMIITFFFMMNIILASVVNSYNNEVAARKQKLRDINKNNLKMAFTLLDTDKQGWIDREAVMTIFLVLNEDCPEIRHIPEETSELLFALLDKSGDNRISEDEFMNFGKVMLVQFESSAVYATCIEKCFPKMYNSQWYQGFCHIIKSERFERLVDIILLLNAVVVAIQSYPELVGQPSSENEQIADGMIDTVWEAFQTAFTAFYCIELAAKVLVLGWKKYLASYRNIFDGAITVLSFAATCYVYYPNRYSDSRLIRYIVTARVLRLVRLLAAIKQFQIIGGTFIDIIPAAQRIVVFLFCIMYAFSSLGLQLFGGVVTRDPSNPLSSRFLGTDFAESQYWANSFNDFLSGFNVLFNLLVINNWQVQADGILAVTGSKWTRLFFLFFHICGVIVVNNLVVAFIIDSFLGEWIQAREGMEEVDAGDAVIRPDKRAYFDATEITGTKTNLSGSYMAKMTNPNLLLSHRMSDELKDLFTKWKSDFNNENTTNQQHYEPATG